MTSGAVGLNKYTISSMHIPRSVPHSEVALAVLPLLSSSTVCTVGEEGAATSQRCGGRKRTERHTTITAAATAMTATPRRVN